MKSKFEWLVIPGLIDYQQSLQIMEQHLNAIISDRTISNKIILLECADVYSTGASYKEEELLDKGDVPVINTRRGGKITYHGPGQRIIYPVINLDNIRDLKRYVYDLEEWIIVTLSKFGVKAFRHEGMVGIWVHDMSNNKPAKIAAIGIKIRKWVAYHGIAVNISTNINKFSNIIPCGIKDYSVTSLERLGINISLKQFDQELQKTFNVIFSDY